MLMRKKKCLRLFLLSNILLFRYQIILILKTIASYYEKCTPDCFVNMYDVIYLVICGIFTSKLEIPVEGNNVLNAEHLVQRLLCCNLPEGAFYMLVTIAQPCQNVL